MPLLSLAVRYMLLRCFFIDYRQIYMDAHEFRMNPLKNKTQALVCAILNTVASVPANCAFRYVAG